MTQLGKAIVVASILAAIVLLPLPATAAPEWMTRPGTIGHALSQPDGGSVSLDAVRVVKIKAHQNPAYFVIQECYDRDARIIVYTAPSPDLRLGQTIDVAGTLATLPNGERAIVDAAVTGYLDKEGHLLYHGPLVKGILGPIPWQWKTDLTVTATSEASAAASDSPLPPGELDSSPPDPPVYYDTIADLLAANPPDGTAVGLQCKPISSTGSDPTYGSYFVMAEDSAPETLKVYYSTSVSTTYRVNDITGQISTEGTNRVLCVDGGPGFDPQGYVGRVQTASAGTIAWAKTFPNSISLPAQGRRAALEAKVVTFVDRANICFYVQEPDGSSGIRAYGSGVVPGDIVDVDGTMTIAFVPPWYETGERMIDTSSFTLVASGNPVAPRAVGNRVADCGAFNKYTPGMPGGSGLNVIGQYVRTWGRVTDQFDDWRTGLHILYLDDGSNLSDGSTNPDTGEQNVGLRVAYSGHIVNTGDLCVVQGVISTCTEDGIVIRPMLSTEGPMSLTPPAPPSPAGLVADAGNGMAYLSWNQCTNMGFNVYRKPSGGSYTKIGSATSTEYADSGLTNGTTYYYYVTAKGTTGESVPSEEASATPSAEAPSISIVQTTLDANGLLTVQYNPQAGTGQSPDRVAILVDGNLVWEKLVSEGTSFVYDTTQLRNGSHKLDVWTSAFDAAGEDLYAARSSSTFSTDNYVYDFQIPEISTGHEPVTARFKGECNWTLTYEQGGNPVHTVSGSGTSLSYTWNCAGSSDETSTIVQLSATPVGGGSNYVYGGHTYTWYYGSVNSSTTCVHWGRDGQADSLEPWFQYQGQYVISKLQSNPQYGYMPNPDFRRRWNDEDDAVYLRDNAIGWPPGWDPPCIYFFAGHGAGGSRYKKRRALMEGAMSGVSVVSGAKRWWGLSAFSDFLKPNNRFHRLGPAIGNSIEYVQTGRFPGRLRWAYLQRRYKFVQLATCHSAEGLMHLAFGMPNRRYCGHGSAYLGVWGATANGAAHGEFTQKFWDYLSQRWNVGWAAYQARLDVIKAHPGDSSYIVTYYIFGDPLVRLWR